MRLWIFEECDICHDRLSTRSFWRYPTITEIGRGKGKLFFDDKLHQATTLGCRIVAIERDDDVQL